MMKQSEEEKSLSLSLQEPFSIFKNMNNKNNKKFSKITDDKNQMQPQQQPSQSPLTNSYLGIKGYVIFKSKISVDQLIRLKKQLTARPKTQGMIVAIPPITYPVFIETETKIYIPRFFGIKEYGVFQNNKLSNGDNINISFIGELRDMQKDVVKKYISNVEEQDRKTAGGGGGGLLELYCGFGKTILALNIISILKKKTLIIVHKEFLLNQWVERIRQFLPDARIGRIQGTTIDVVDKDIVIGMLQSLSMKNYEDSTFSSFGLMVVDEVHHISSEVFSKALFKIVTKYTLGLSATMERKDGCSYIFNYFLGDILFKSIKKETEQIVEVRKINYISSDPDFNEMVVDYKGNPQYSSMIVKLCAFNYRTEFILKVIYDMMTENPNQQIIVLAHNLNVIKYMFDAIQYRNIPGITVGKYVGGMKEKDLKESELKKVILGTYSMAAEGLDIPTLTTLILVTPKTDIIQAVGRILRVKDNQPVIVDIVDSHGIFQNQYRKRQTFYRKNNYRIIETSNVNYTTDISQWKMIFNPCKGLSVELKDDEDFKYTPVGKCLIRLKKTS